MDQKNINLLTTHEYYRIESQKTGRLYLDQNLKCYLFDTEREAKSFCEGVPDTIIKSAGYLKYQSFVTECFYIGATTIRVKAAREETFTDIEIERKDAKRQYYNAETEGNILRLLQTSKKKYMTALKNTTLIAPISVASREEKQHPAIYYGYATFGGSKKYFLLFTTIGEFQNWEKKMDIRYDPLETTLLEFRTVRNGAPILINPETDKLILNDKQIQEVLIS